MLAGQSDISLGSLTQLNSHLLAWRCRAKEQKQISTDQLRCLVRFEKNSFPEPDKITNLKQTIGVLLLPALRLLFIELTIDGKRDRTKAN